MDAITLLTISQVCLCFALIASRKPLAAPEHLIAQTLRVEPGQVFVLEARRPISHTEYPKLRAYLDEMEKHTGARFALVDGALRVVAVRSSE